jgi:hypothetical protein
MNDPDNFLSRWSRRKRQDSQDSDEQPENAGGEQASVAPTLNEEANQTASASQQTVSPVAEFDVTSLPPIESIGAGTDISAFMQPGVPSALRHAALRRAWTADPAIRDFMGLTENYWDAVGPDGIPGFGPLDPKLDVQRMVAELFGDTPPESAQRDSTAPPSASGTSAAESGEKGERDNTDKRPASLTDDVPSGHSGNGAPQKKLPRSQADLKIVRRHGGAMPE